jgi:hypothetical protein
LIPEKTGSKAITDQEMEAYLRDGCQHIVKIRLKNHL